MGFLRDFQGFLTIRTDFGGSLKDPRTNFGGFRGIFQRLLTILANLADTLKIPGGFLKDFGG